MTFSRQKRLAPLNTLASDVTANYFASWQNERELDALLEAKPRDLPCVVLGGGSNVVFAGDYPGVVLHNGMQGIEITKDDAEHVWVTSAGGVEWHALVQWSIAKGYSGIENLSLIPGTVGAAPIQNIGAYGVELCDVFVSLEAVELATGRRVSKRLKECQFGYRDSIFKSGEYAGKWVIISVTLRLSKQPRFVTQYGEIEKELDARCEVLSPALMSDVIVTIRRRKLPNPAELPNCGSFFKNPVVDQGMFGEIKKAFPTIVNYPLEDGSYKLAAGWVIDQLGWKGKEVAGAKVHDKQALVLINTGGGGRGVIELSNRINRDVFAALGFYLEVEPKIIG